MIKPESAWLSAVGEIEIGIGRASYATWLKSARFIKYEDGQFVIGVQNGYVKEWMETRLLSQLKRVLVERMGCEVEVAIVLIAQNGSISFANDTFASNDVYLGTTANKKNGSQSNGKARSTVASATATAATIDVPHNAALSPAAEMVTAGQSMVETAPSRPNKIQAIESLKTQANQPITIPMSNASSTFLATGDGLNPKYRFETFVVGNGNRLAHAAAEAVAENPADRYNPLFLYGGAGLGKTHLLHAIGHAARQRGLRCFYITSETFTNELISAIRSQSTEAFRNKYRNVDVFLMDDVQFIAGKESTQEEFFHTFNALHSANKQIVVTSDRTPKSMGTLEERLRSRFEWGLMADIAPPDYETRIAILQQKAHQINTNIQPEVVEFVAKQVQSNVRELEGALNRLIASSLLTGRALTIQLARDTLSDLVGKRSNITPSQVIETVAKHYNLSVPEIVSAGRNKELVLPRQIAMFLIRQETDASLPEIGGLLGGRDHTTVMHGIERVKDRLEIEDQLRRVVMSLREQLYLNVDLPSKV
ncbi:MAG: chromosomal replication initiator protein DnaA [Anaerolineae bacterium]|nr:chromosomal replication initiator protein DnaA [Anaerolineae bacterium]